ncbi:MAG: hypothetical protein ACOVQM_23255 [Pirellula sp.]
MKERVLFFLVFFCTLVNSLSVRSELLADEVGREKAREEADLFLVQCEIGARECLYVANVSITSAADASLLFESKGLHQRLQVKEGDLEIVSWFPKVFSDDRDDKTTLPVYVQVANQWTRFHDQGREFGVFAKEDGTQEAVVINTKTIQKIFYPQCWSIELYDWPFVRGDIFVRSSERGLASISFAGEHQCFDGTIQSDGSVESCWGRPGKSNFLLYHVFKDGLLIKEEVMFFEKEFHPEIKLPDKKFGISFSIVETKWKTLGDDDVPSRVHATFRDGFQLERSLNDLVAEIKCFDKDSMEFKEAVEVRKKLVEQVMTEKNEK